VAEHDLVRDTPVTATEGPLCETTKTAPLDVNTPTPIRDGVEQLNPAAGDIVAGGNPDVVTEVIICWRRVSKDRRSATHVGRVGGLIATAVAGLAWAGKLLPFRYEALFDMLAEAVGQFGGFR
jgi:hypothetical protein